MMVPLYIKKKMHSVVKYSRASAAAMKVVESWLELHGIDPESIRDGNGCSLEELEYGNDIVDSLCERIEGEIK